MKKGSEKPSAFWGGALLDLLHVKLFQLIMNLVELRRHSKDFEQLRLTTSGDHHCSSSSTEVID
jgi:hypothetical protein